MAAGAPHHRPGDPKISWGIAPPPQTLNINGKLATQGTARGATHGTARETDSRSLEWQLEPHTTGSDPENPQARHTGDSSGAAQGTARGVGSQFRGQLCVTNFCDATINLTQKSVTQKIDKNICVDLLTVCDTIFHCLSVTQQISPDVRCPKISCVDLL